MARRISWTNNSSGHDGTYVYRAPTLDPQNLPAPVATVAPVVQGETAEWVDSEELATGDYDYAVRDFDGAALGQLSAVIGHAVSNAVTATYWRIYITKTREAGTWEASLAEVEFRSSQGVPESHAGTALASTAYFPAADAFDGDGGTVWLSGSGATMPQWVGMDMGASHSTVEILLQAAGDATGAGRAPEDFEIQTSEDGSQWNTVKAFVAEPAWSAGEIRTYTL